MQEMLEYIVKNLVSNPDAVEVVLENQGKTKVFKVKVLLFVSYLFHISI